MFVAALAAVGFGVARPERQAGPAAVTARLLGIGALALISALRDGPQMLTLALAADAVGGALLDAPSSLARTLGWSGLMLGRLACVSLLLPVCGGAAAFAAEPLRNLALGAVAAGWSVSLAWLWPRLGANKALGLAYGLASFAAVLTTLALPAYFFLAISGGACLVAADILCVAGLAGRLDGAGARLAWWLRLVGAAQLACACLK